MTVLLAIAGPSRSGKGTIARVIAEECEANGLTLLERQLSDNGKWSAARIFRPTIGRAEAVAWFEELKTQHYGARLNLYWKLDENSFDEITVPLQKFLQNSLQAGGRDIFGDDFWTDMIIQRASIVPRRWHSKKAWLDTFFDAESRELPTDVAIISDLRQVNEARRVRELRGIVVEAVRPDVDDAYVTGGDHVTERALPRELVDHTIVNDGTVEELEAKARLLFYAHLNHWICAGSRVEQPHS